jgi:cell division protein FtsB
MSYCQGCANLLHERDRILADLAAAERRAEELKAENDRLRAELVANEYRRQNEVAALAGIRAREALNEPPGHPRARGQEGAGG